MRSSACHVSGFGQRVERQVELQHVDARLAEDAERCGPRCAASTSARTWASRQAARLGDARHLEAAAAGVMCGSRPLPEVVTRSTGTGASAFSASSCSTSPCDALDQRLARSGRGWSPRVATLEARHVVARWIAGGRRRAGRGSSRSSVKFWPISSEPTPCRRADDQAAVGLVREHDLGDAGDRQRIDEAGQRSSAATSMTRAGRSWLQHGRSPQARPMAVTARSISLMPTNGTTRPPRP